jgi:hypothetical protein
MFPGLPAACAGCSGVSGEEFIVGELESFIEIPSGTLPVSVRIELCALTIATQARRTAANRNSHPQFVFEELPILAIDFPRAPTHTPV